MPTILPINRESIGRWDAEGEWGAPDRSSIDLSSRGSSSPSTSKIGMVAVPSGSIDQKTFSVGYHLAREPGRLALLEDFKLYMARLTTNANQSLQPSDGVKQRGRPRDPAKREKLLATARTLFLKDGADAVTMDRIVAASGLARATLYAYFRDKTELLEAVIARESERIVDGKWLEDARFLETRSALQYFGVRLLALIGDPEQLDCEKLISQAARKTPEYGRRFFAAGPGRSLILLTQLIEIGQANRTFNFGELQPISAIVSKLSGSSSGNGGKS